MANSSTEGESPDYWRAGCECNRAGLCYRCRAAAEIDRLLERERVLLEAHTGCGCEPTCAICREKGFT